MNYLIYSRVSPRGSDFDGETTIKMQADYCKEYIKFHNGEVLDVVSDEFYSGKDMERPAFAKLMVDLESGRAEWDTLIVYKLSRLTRSLKDGANIFALLFAQGKGFVSATENLDFSNPAGRAMLGMMQVFNQFEREQGAENVRNKMISIAKQGLWPAGRAPYGYKREGKKDNKLYVDPRKAAVVQDCFQMYAGDKYTTRSILSKYKGKLTKSQLMKILRNPIYLGKMAYADKIFPGKHEPIINENLFKAVQTKLPQAKKAIRPKAQKYPFLLSGLLDCHCGRKMTPKTAKSGAYAYYTCTDTLGCKNRVSAPKVENSAIEYLKTVDKKKEFTASTIKKIKADQAKELERNQPKINQLNAALEETKREKAKVFKLLINSSLNNELTNMANGKIEQLTKEISTIEDQLAIIKSTCDDSEIYEMAVNMIKNMQNFSLLLNEEHQTKTGIRQAFLGNIHKIKILPDQNYLIYPTYGESSTKGIKWYAS